ncbi:MAG: lipopolysaccharide transport periplasmic protein LptA [Burkholderiaceae bacterium]|jgi:lipopolysaccharide export system protein LptA|nr:lipopolysaccharide transport periplasmic protein LptA [Burkholderiaceae bacterium]
MRRQPVLRLLPRRIACVASVLVAALAVVPAAWAEKADRSLPLTIEADKSSTVDLAKQVVVFLGNVVITQGTMRIEADRVEVRETPEGWRSAVATGTPAQPATFRQKRDGVDETIEGRAQRIEYDGRADTVRLSGNATMRRLRAGTTADDVSGALITYDNGAELFSVAGGGEGRVRAVLTPRPEPAPAAGERRP